MQGDPNLPIDPDESTAEEFAEAVGRGVIVWQQVEMRCADLFARLLIAANGLGAHGVFYKINSFSARLELMEIAARFRFMPGDATMKSWRELRAELRTASVLRNRLAHSEVAEAMTETGWKFSLCPPLDFSKIDPDKMDAVVSRRKQQILAFTQVAAAEPTFEKLAQKVLEFARTVAELNGALPKEMDDDGEPSGNKVMPFTY